MHACMHPSIRHSWEFLVGFSNGEVAHTKTKIVCLLVGLFDGSFWNSSSVENIDTKGIVVVVVVFPPTGFHPASTFGLFAIFTS